MRGAIFCLLLAGPAFAREVPITILHTCDLHGHILPTESYEGRTNVGGLARCATVIRQVRAKQPNTLLVDAGDTIQGDAVSFLSDGLVMVKAFNLLRYDAWVWGNHEFDWGLAKLTNCLAQARVPILNANLKGLPVKPYRVVEVDGVKVGIIGLNTPGIPNWSRPRLLGGVKIADSVETLRAVVPAVKRAGATVLVLVCHQGYREAGDDHANQINAIARNFPELDVIIAGHTHRNFPEFKVNNVLYCQADYFGIHLGRVDLVFDTKAGKITRRESTTVLMDEHIALDQELVHACAAELSRAEKELATVIGEATVDFDNVGVSRRETALHDLILDAIAGELCGRGVKVDVVVHGLLDRLGSLKAGPVRIRDVWRLIPYENTIGVMELTGVELREVLEENAAALEKRDFRGVWGVHCQFDPAAPIGQRVVSVTWPDGRPVGDADRLAVAFNSYELASGGLRWNKVRKLADDPGSKLIEYDFQTRQAVIDYIRRAGKIGPVVHGWWRVERSGKP